MLKQSFAELCTGHEWGCCNSEEGSLDVSVEPFRSIVGVKTYRRRVAIMENSNSSANSKLTTHYILFVATHWFLFILYIQQLQVCKSDNMENMYWFQDSGIGPLWSPDICLIITPSDILATFHHAGRLCRTFWCLDWINAAQNWAGLFSSPRCSGIAPRGVIQNRKIPGPCIW